LVIRSSKTVTKRITPQSEIEIDIPADADQLVGGSAIGGGEVHTVNSVAAVIGGEEAQERLEGLALARSVLSNNLSVIDLVSNESSLVAGLLEVSELLHNRISDRDTSGSHFLEVMKDRRASRKICPTDKIHKPQQIAQSS